MTDVPQAVPVDSSDSPHASPVTASDAAAATAASTPVPVPPGTKLVYKLDYMDGMTEELWREANDVAPSAGVADGDELLRAAHEAGHRGERGVREYLDRVPTAPPMPMPDEPSRSRSRSREEREDRDDSGRGPRRRREAHGGESSPDRDASSRTGDGSANPPAYAPSAPSMHRHHHAGVVTPIPLASLLPLLLLVLLVLLGMASMIPMVERTDHDGYTLVGTRWRRTIKRETLEPVRESGFDVPDGAYDVRNNGPVHSHYETVPISSTEEGRRRTTTTTREVCRDVPVYGEETYEYEECHDEPLFRNETRCEMKSVYSHTEVDVDGGNGNGEPRHVFVDEEVCTTVEVPDGSVRVCEPRTGTRTVRIGWETKCETVEVEDPSDGGWERRSVKRPHYSWTVDRWRPVVPDLVATGDERSTPRWPRQQQQRMGIMSGPWDGAVVREAGRYEDYRAIVRRREGGPAATFELPVHVDVGRGCRGTDAEDLHVLMGGRVGGSISVVTKRPILSDWGIGWEEPVRTVVSW